MLKLCSISCKRVKVEYDRKSGKILMSLDVAGKAYEFSGKYAGGMFTLANRTCNDFYSGEYGLMYDELEIYDDKDPFGKPLLLASFISLEWNKYTFQIDLSERDKIVKLYKNS